jgi:hypothetical protein
VRLNVTDDYARSVFINCPFDEQYKPLFDAIVFTVQIAGYKPRCAREVSNAAQARIDKLLDLINQCRLGIHDISRTQLSRYRLPRFNMPFELGMDIACRRFGGRHHQKKSLLVMDKTPFRYQKFISDIAGQDIIPHNNSQREIIRNIRDWLSTFGGGIPGGAYIYRRFHQFQCANPKICKIQKLEFSELTFGDLTKIVRIFLEETA